MSGYIGPIPVPQGIQNKETFTATAGQTTFNTNGYTDGAFISVYLNGVRLINGTDYTATNGSDVVLASAAAASDVVDFESFNSFSLASQQFENITTKNPTHEDTDGGRESAISFQGEQSGGEISTLAAIQASHDGTADDQKGDLIFKTNDGSDNNAPTERMRIDSGGAVTFTSDDTSDQFVIQNNDAGTSSAPDMVLYRNSASPADGDVIGRIDYRGKDDGAVDRDYITLYSKIADASNGSAGGSFHIQTRTGATTGDRFVIGGNGNVGIGVNDPDAVLDVSGGSNKLGILRVVQRVSGAAAYGLDIGLDPTFGDPVFSKIENDVAAESFRIRRTNGALISSGGITLGTASGAYAAANTLDYYEEGTWAPTSNGATGVSNPSTVRGALYTRVGNLVTVNAEFVLPTNSNSSQCNIGGLPYPTSNTSVYRDIGNAAANVSFGLITYVVNNASNFGLYNDENYGAVTYATLSGKTIVVNITYKTDS